MSQSNKVAVNRIATAAAKRGLHPVQITQREAREFLDALVYEFGAELRDCGSLTVPMFGKFRVAVRAARTTRHPKTREPVALPANVEVRFSASADLTARLENWLTRSR